MKLSSVACCILLCTLGSGAAFAGTWRADPITGCTVFDTEESTVDVLVSWSGECDAEKRATGDGVLSWIEAGRLIARYDGEMVAGRAEGEGALLILAGQGGYHRAEGHFEASEVAGPVKINTAEGDVFVGQLHSLDMSGAGIVTTAAGDQYTGDIRNAQMNGAGHLVLADGEQYRGTFENNEIKGVGEWLGAQGDYYKGAFRDGEFSGSGRFEATDGAVYEGMFVEGLPEGQGRYIEADGRVIAGEFKAGWPDGQVSVTTPDGATLTEYWAEGRKEEPKKED